MSRNKELCYLCKNLAKNPTYEHLQPISRGGSRGGVNRQIACFDCNSIKGDMTLREFWSFVDTGKLSNSYIEHLEDRKRKKMKELNNDL